MTGISFRIQYDLGQVSLNWKAQEKIIIVFRDKMFAEKDVVEKEVEGYPYGTHGFG